MPITKVIAANDFVNGAAYINPNSLKIPSTLQTLSVPSGISTPVYQSASLTAPSGVLQNRFKESPYDINIVQVSGVPVSAVDL